MTVSQVAQAFQSPRKIGRDKWKALCPIHGDRKPSLHIWGGDRWVLLKCQSHQCAVVDIVKSVGLRMRDLCYTSRDFSSEALQALQKQQRINRLYEAEMRIRDLKLWLKSLECKWKPVRVKTQFERDIEAAYR